MRSVYEHMQPCRVMYSLRLMLEQIREIPMKDATPGELYAKHMKKLSCKYPFFNLNEHVFIIFIILIVCCDWDMSSVSPTNYIDLLVEKDFGWT